MKTVIKFAVLLFTFALLIPTITNAETKKNRIYAYVTKSHVIPVGFVKAPANMIIERRGVAEFEDGEVATVLIRASGKMIPKGGQLEGFTLYTFEDGASYATKWKVQLVKKEGSLPTISGKGTIVNGTGRFKGIKGDSTSTGKFLTPYSKEKGTFGDIIVDHVVNYTMPKK